MSLQTEKSDHETETERPLTWGQRHGLKLMAVIMAALFALVVIVQVVR